MFILVACVIHARYKLFSKTKTGINSFVNQWIIKFRLMRFHSIGASIKVIFTLLFLILFFCNCAFVCITPPHYRVFTQRKHIFAYILMYSCICKKIIIIIMSAIKRCTQMTDTFLTDTFETVPYFILRIVWEPSWISDILPINEVWTKYHFTLSDKRKRKIEMSFRANFQRHKFNIFLLKDLRTHQSTCQGPLGTHVNRNHK